MIKLLFCSIFLDNYIALYIFNTLFIPPKQCPAKKKTAFKCCPTKQYYFNAIQLKKEKLEKKRTFKFSPITPPKKIKHTNIITAQNKAPCIIDKRRNTYLNDKKKIVISNYIEMLKVCKSAFLTCSLGRTLQHLKSQRGTNLTTHQKHLVSQ